MIQNPSNINNVIGYFIAQRSSHIQSSTPIKIKFIICELVAGFFFSLLFLLLRFAFGLLLMAFSLIMVVDFQPFNFTAPLYFHSFSLNEAILELCVCDDDFRLFYIVIN